MKVFLGDSIGEKQVRQEKKEGEGRRGGKRKELASLALQTGRGKATA